MRPARIPLAGILACHGQYVRSRTCRARDRGHDLCSVRGAGRAEPEPPRRGRGRCQLRDRAGCRPVRPGSDHRRRARRRRRACRVRGLASASVVTTGLTDTHASPRRRDDADDSAGARRDDSRRFSSRAGSGSRSRSPPRSSSGAAGRSIGPPSRTCVTGRRRWTPSSRSARSPPCSGRWSRSSRLDDAHTYFEVGAVITTLILLGRYLESRARRRSGEAIRSLLELGAKEANVHSRRRRGRRPDRRARGRRHVRRAARREDRDRRRRRRRAARRSTSRC